MKTLIIPGISNSGPDHWQTHWEHLHSFTRIQQKEWENPVYADWEASLLEQILNSPSQQNFLVGHSLGCLLIGKALLKIQDRIQGILLVAPPDPKSDVFPKGLTDFQTFPKENLGIPGLILYSENDPFATVSYSETLASNWGLQSINLGRLGHINSESNLGAWDTGYKIYSTFVQDLLSKRSVSNSTK
ncbi:RBBP9/YdeN family alpha/beta hydrolase [Leptospira sp. WS92.C1]